MNRVDIVIAGVGGQGTVLASRVLAQAALNCGLPARTSETIGMAQREGTVQSHVRIGLDDLGPVIPKQSADILLGFEPAEAQRASLLLKPSGKMIVNIHPISPVTVALRGAAYPLAAVQEYLTNLPVTARLVNAFELAMAAGNFRTVNTVMLGMLAAEGTLPMPQSVILEVLLEMLPERVREVNERAFRLGNEAMNPKI
ncbi:MAG TPA: indolepyruvate oxidoreductase subunit beta [Bacillota bacterium]|nr:indolepyruvate oxidoreductase subunit beta [Bacillota bacterium]